MISFKDFVEQLKESKNSVKKLDESYDPSEYAKEQSKQAGIWEKTLDATIDPNGKHGHIIDNAKRQCVMAHERAAEAHHQALWHHKEKTRRYEDLLDGTQAPTKEETKNLSNLRDIHASEVAHHRIEKNYHLKAADNKDFK